MENYSKILAKNITYHRKEKGLTQEALAEKLGVSFQAISKWENELSCPDILLLPHLSKIFGVSIDELYGNKVAIEVSKNQSFHISDLPWLDDEIIRGVVFLGHKILNNSDDMSKFTFKLEGQSFNVISHCNIECDGIQNGAQAACDINCTTISGGAKAGCDINCNDINGGAKAGCDINCVNITGGATAECDVNCNNISGDVSAASSNSQVNA